MTLIALNNYYVIKFSKFRNRNDSLKISVKAVLTRSLMRGLINGNPICHIELMKKSPIFSAKKIATKLVITGETRVITNKLT